MTKALRILMVTGLVLLMATSAFAAKDDKNIDKGTLYAGFQTGIGLTNPYGTYFPGSINTIQGGYFVSDGFEIGPVLSLMYNSDTTTTEPDGGTESEDTSSGYLFGLGVQLNYYFSGRGFSAPYVGIALQYGMANTEMVDETPAGNDVDTTTTTTDGSGFIIMPRAGIAFFVTKNFAIDPSLYISYASMSGTTSVETEPAGGASTTADTDNSMSNMDIGFMVGFNFFW